MGRYMFKNTKDYTSDSTQMIDENGNLKKDFKDKPTGTRAMEDINKHGALSVEYEPIKQGRAYTGVIFTFKTVKPKKEGLHAFMKRIRSDCVHKVLLITKDKDTGKDIELSVSENGLLYNRLDPDWKIPKSRAEEIWKILHRQKVC